MREAALDPFPYISNHVLLPRAERLEDANKLMRQAITPRTLGKIVDLLPDEWLESEDFDGKTAAEVKQDYKDFLNLRLANSDIFTHEAIRQRNKLLNL